MGIRKKSFADSLFYVVGYLMLGIFTLAIIFPIFYVIIASFMDPTVLQNKGISFDFSNWSTDAYRRVLENRMIWVGFKNSIIYSVAFSVVSVGITVLAAYPMSKKDLIGKKIFNAFFVITMFFGGGLVPTYLLISDLKMLDTIWAVILPNAFNVWNMILARTYYQSIPTELREASAIDGASELVYFFKILFPVCKPIVLVLVLYQFVGMWNSYFDPMIYLSDANMQPLQLVLRSILIQNTPEPGMVSDITGFAEMSKIAELLKYSTIVVSSIPLLIMYPFFQKYFEKGIMVGSIKG
jgi:putative aldouronate transport system permease protein